MTNATNRTASGHGLVAGVSGTDTAFDRAAFFRIDERDPAPTCVQIARRIRVAVAAALKHELSLHGHPQPSVVEPEPLGSAQGRLLGVRNRLRGRISAFRAGELIAEVTLEVPPTQPTSRR